MVITNTLEILLQENALSTLYRIKALSDLVNRFSPCPQAFMRI